MKTMVRADDMTPNEYSAVTCYLFPNALGASMAREADFRQAQISPPRDVAGGSGLRKILADRVSGHDDVAANLQSGGVHSVAGVSSGRKERAERLGGASQCRLMARSDCGRSKRHTRHPEAGGARRRTSPMECASRR